MFGVLVLCCVSRRDSGDRSSFSLLFGFCCIIGRVVWLSMGGDGFQTQRRKSWVPGKTRAEKVLADAIRTDGRIEWICKFCSQTNVWTRWRCRWCSQKFLRVCKGSTKKPSLRKTKWYSGSSSSSGSEERWPGGQDEELKKLRAQVENAQPSRQGVWHGQDARGAPSRR